MRKQSQPAAAAWSPRGPGWRAPMTLPLTLSLTLAMLVVALVALLPAAAVAAPAPAAVLAAPAADAVPAAAEAVPALEAQVLALVNQARAEQGLAPVAWNPTLSRVAAAHARDMIDNRYFSHLSPTTGTPGRRARQGGVTFKHLGENLAGNRDLADAHRMLMESPAHRANILGNEFTQVGIAVVPGGAYGYMIVEMFIEPAIVIEPAIATAQSQPSSSTSGDAR